MNMIRGSDDLSTQVSPEASKERPTKEEFLKDLYLLWSESRERRILMGGKDAAKGKEAAKGKNATEPEPSLFPFGAIVGLAIASGCVVAIAILWPIIAALSTDSPWRVALLSIEALLGTVTALILIIIGSVYGAARRGFYERVKMAKSRAVDVAVEDLRDDASLGKLLVLNRRQLDDYHLSSIRQQSIAFRNAQIAAAIGFARLVLGAILAMRQSGDTARYLAADLSALGTALSGYVASVFFRSYRETSREMERYYEEPFNTYETLMIERIADLKENYQLRAKIVQHLMAQRLIDRLDHGATESLGKEVARQLQRDINPQDGENSAEVT